MAVNWANSGLVKFNSMPALNGRAMKCILPTFHSANALADSEGGAERLGGVGEDLGKQSADLFFPCPRRWAECFF